MLSITKHIGSMLIVILLAAGLTSCGKIPPNLTAIYYAKKKENTKKAVDEYTKAINEAPNEREFASIYCQRAYEYIELGDYQKAIDDYSKALSLDSKFVRVLDIDSKYIYGWRGYCYKKLGQYQKALDDYNKWISLRSDYAPALSYAWRCLYKILANIKRQ